MESINTNEATGTMPPEKQPPFEIYEGKGASGRALPDPRHFPSLNHPGLYVAGRGLRDAVNVALALGQPLLVTGEPGTGKTDLATSIAYEFDLNLEKFVAKTTSTSTDLFYQYDALRHFNDITIRQHTHHQGLSDLNNSDVKTENYIEYRALGRAILLSQSQDIARKHLSNAEGAPRRSVVLIDEIDKAPRDFPNDLLDEIARMEFTVKELTEKEAQRTFTAPNDKRPVVVITSNSENDLPEPFLRRCVFYHIGPPSDETLKEILQKRLGADPALTDAAVLMFKEICQLGLRKKPATAELIDWVRLLQRRETQAAQVTARDQTALGPTLPALVKTKEDLDMVCMILRESKPSPH